ncbi:histone-lysine N-methyltransferase 2D-like isoform X3 [Carassius carassius]|uniref:histone-lysine N-methyltransferase 2D-like isoform X3 n=1 Tax=Carassius carassius TaxID=217509 RepID=UPI002868C3EC|nr:histone-lysine N-methyltransferase 2D-like isoform X3 [Carassius carassius]
MFGCRAAWQRCGPLARQSLNRAQISRNVVPRRLMSSVPGGSGENFLYVVLCGGAFAGAVAYAYRTVATDHARFVDRVSEIDARPKSDWKPKPWPPKSKSHLWSASAEEGEMAETVEAAVEEDVPAEAPEFLLETAEATRGKAGTLEAVVEKVAETVAETEEVVAEVAGVVHETAEEVAAVAEEVQKVAEEVEEAAEAVITPVIQAEEPASESNGSVTTAAAETIELAAASVFETVLVESGSVEDVSIKALPEMPTEVPTADHLENVPVTEVAPVAPVMEEEPASLVAEAPDATIIVEPPVAEQLSIPPVSPAAEVFVASVIEAAPVSPVVEEPAFAAVEEVTPVVKETPADSPVPSEEASDVPVIEEEVLFAPVKEETPITPEAEEVSVTPVTAETSIAPEAEEESVTPLIEEMPVAPVPEEAAVSFVTEEAPAVVAEDAPVVATEELDETLAPKVAEEDIPVVEEVKAEEVIAGSAVVEAPVSIVQEQAASPVVEVTESVVEPDVPSTVVTEEVAPAETSSAPSEEPKRDYIVVILEGAPKTEKKPMVLGVSPVTGKIIPAPDDGEDPLGQGKRRLLKVQMY